MKILHVINGLDDGGAEGVLYRLCVYDKALGTCWTAPWERAGPFSNTKMNLQKRKNLQKRRLQKRRLQSRKKRL